MMHPYINKRGRNESTEAFFYNALGYFARPGYGDKLDEQRMSTLWTIFQQGFTHKSSQQVENQWWIFWRRVSGGLDQKKQNKLFSKLFA